MRAYVLKHYGGLKALADESAPTRASRDILVGVRAAELNPVDFKFRQGSSAQSCVKTSVCARQ